MFIYYSGQRACICEGIGIHSVSLHTCWSGLGRVLDKSTRVQVLEKMTIPSTSTGFSEVLEYK